MKRVAIIGLGELGYQFYNFLSTDLEIEFIFFDDTAVRNKKTNNALPFKDYKNKNYNSYDFFIALGYHNLIKKTEIINDLMQLKRSVPFYIHPTSFVNKSASLGHGTFIYPMCNIDKEAKIGAGVLINNSVCISHNNIIGDGCYLSPGVTTSGNVQIGTNTFIGTGSVISNNIKIGSNVKIGIGTVITKNIPDDCSAIGNPVRILNNPIKII